MTSVLEHRYAPMPLVSLLANLPELLLAHVASDARVALIVERGTRYVQFLATEHHELVVECVSNRYLEAGDEWSLDDELTLLSLGFEPPECEPEPHPNFWWHSAEPTDLMVACRMAAAVLGDLLALGAHDEVVLIERPLPRRM
jgi:hypothetical protein